MKNQKRILMAAVEAAKELTRAKSLFPEKLNSKHEGYGVLLEEVDELWDEIKKKNPDLDKVRTEAIQVAAMALRIVVECTPEPTDEQLNQFPIVEILALKSDAKQDGCESAEEFLREKYKLVDFHGLTINGKSWLELMEEYANQQPKPMKEGYTPAGFLKSDYAKALQKENQARCIAVARIQSLCNTLKLNTRPIKGHTDPNSINDCWAEMDEMVWSLVIKPTPSAINEGRAEV